METCFKKWREGGAPCHKSKMIIELNCFTWQAWTSPEINTVEHVLLVLKKKEQEIEPTDQPITSQSRKMTKLHHSRICQGMLNKN